MIVESKIKYLKKRPSLAQFAINGIWEEAFSFTQNSIPNQKVISEKFSDINAVSYTHLTLPTKA